MVCHCSVPDSSPQPDTKVLHPATLTHPAKAMTPAQRRQLALEALARTETVNDSHDCLTPVVWTGNHQSRATDPPVCP